MILVTLWTNKIYEIFLEYIQNHKRTYGIYNFLFQKKNSMKLSSLIMKSY